MTRRASSALPGGTRFAGARLRLLARCLGLLAVLCLALPAVEAHPAAAAGPVLAAHLGLDVASAAPADHPDGVTHHCAQCGCHQAVTAELATAPPPAWTGLHRPAAPGHAPAAGVFSPPDRPPRG
jgi:hypothetical protein